MERVSTVIYKYTIVTGTRLPFSFEKAGCRLSKYDVNITKLIYQKSITMTHVEKSSVYDHEPFHFTPAYDLADIICEGSDEDETLEFIEQKHLRYENEARRCADGKLPILQSTILKGPLSPTWINPWRYESSKVYNNERRYISERNLLDNEYPIKKASNRGPRRFSAEDSVTKYKATLDDEAIQIGMSRGDVFISVEKDNRVKKKTFCEGKLLDIPMRRKLRGTRDLFLRRDSYIAYTDSKFPESETKGLKRKREHQKNNGSRNSKCAKWNDEAITSPTPTARSIRARRSKKLLILTRQPLSVSSSQSFLSIPIPRAWWHAKGENRHQDLLSVESKSWEEFSAISENLGMTQKGIYSMLEKKTENYDELESNLSSPSASSLVFPVNTSSQQRIHSSNKTSQSYVDCKLAVSDITSLDDDELSLRDEQGKLFIAKSSKKKSTPCLKKLASEQSNNQQFTSEYDSSSRDFENFMFRRKRKYRKSILELDFPNARKKRKKSDQNHKALDLNLLNHEKLNGDTTSRIVSTPNDSNILISNSAVSPYSVSGTQPCKIPSIENESCFVGASDCSQDELSINIPMGSKTPDRSSIIQKSAFPKILPSDATWQVESKPKSKRRVLSQDCFSSKAHLNQCLIRNETSSSQLSSQNYVSPKNHALQNISTDMFPQKMLERSFHDSQVKLPSSHGVPLEILSPCTSISKDSQSNLSEVFTSPIFDTMFQFLDAPATKDAQKTRITNLHSPNSSLDRAISQPHQSLSPRKYESRIKGTREIDKTIQVDSYESDIGVISQNTPHKKSPAYELKIKNSSVAKHVEVGKSGTQELSYCSEKNDGKHNLTHSNGIIQSDLSNFKEMNEDSLCIQAPTNQDESHFSGTRGENNVVSTENSINHQLSQSPSQTENGLENMTKDATTKVVKISGAIDSRPVPQSPWAAEAPPISLVYNEDRPDLQSSVGNFVTETGPVPNISPVHDISKIKFFTELRRDQDGAASSALNNDNEGMQLSKFAGIQTLEVARQTDTQTLFESAIKNPWKSVLKKRKSNNVTKRVSFKSLELEEEIPPVENLAESQCSSDSAEQKPEGEGVESNSEILTTTNIYRLNDPTPEKFPVLFSKDKNSQESSSQNVSAMAEAFIAADHSTEREKNYEEVMTRSSDLPSLIHGESFTLTDIPEVDFDAMLGDLGEILEDWSVETELNKIKLANQSKCEARNSTLK